MGKLLKKPKIVFILLAIVVLSAMVFYYSQNQKPIEPVYAQGDIIYVDNSSSGCSTPSDTNYDPDTRTCGSGKFTVYTSTDSASGKQTINFAVSNMNGGDTLYVRAGTYKEWGSIDISGLIGTAENYTTIQPYPDGDGYENVYITKSWHIFFGESIYYMKIMGFDISDYRAHAFNIYGNVTHLEIRDNYIHDKQSPITSDGVDGDCIKIAARKWIGYEYGCPTDFDYAMTDIIVDNNTLENVWSTEGHEPPISGQNITVWWDVQRFQFTNNTLINCPDIGISAVGKTRMGSCGVINKYPTGGIISDNTIINGGKSGVSDTQIYIDGAKEILIENNVIRDALNYGIVVGCEDVTGTTEKIIVRNNRLVSNGKNISIHAEDATVKEVRVLHNTALMKDEYDYVNMQIYDCDDVKTENNLFYRANITYQSGWGGYGRQVSNKNTATNLSIDYNDYYDDGYFVWDSNAYYTLGTYKTGSSQDANSISSDPLFVDLANDVLTLQSNSPCIDPAIDTFLTTVTQANGTGTVFTVADSLYFHDGYGITGVAGDTIIVGTDTCVITDVNYATDTITVSSSFTWVQGDNVSYAYSGTKPDIGAYEYQSSQSACLRPDLVCNQSIDQGDFDLFKSYFQTQNPDSDFNNDQKTNTQDLGIMMSVWGE